MDREMDDFTYEQFLANMQVNLIVYDKNHKYLQNPKWEHIFCQERWVKEGGIIEECEILYRAKGRLDLISGKR